MMFKVGDVVRCVDNKGKESWLKEGVCYIIESVEQCGEVSVSVDGLPLTARFAGNRFELVQEAQGCIYKPAIEQPRKAPETLRCAADTLAERGRQYDKNGEERSMAKVVQIFNLVHGTNLTIEQGWDFMATLKHVRAFAQPGTVHEDSMIDRIAYVALCEEEARK